MKNLKLKCWAFQLPYILKEYADTIKEHDYQDYQEALKEESDCYKGIEDEQPSSCCLFAGVFRPSHQCQDCKKGGKKCRKDYTRPKSPKI